MPTISTIQVTGAVGSPIIMWNIGSNVGKGGVNSPLNVKLVQFLLANATGDELPTVITGLWDPISDAMLRGIFPGTSLTDKIIDPIRPGQAAGSISHVIYRMVFLQTFYLSKRFGSSATMSPDDLLFALLDMPENAGPDMPADLRATMIASPDSGSGLGQAAGAGGASSALQQSGAGLLGGLGAGAGGAGGAGGFF